MLAMFAAAIVAQAHITTLRTFGEPAAVRGRACELWDATPVRRTAPAPQLRRLGDLPKANLEIAVLRRDRNGCSIPLIVRYDVEGDGRAAGR